MSIIENMIRYTRYYFVFVLMLVLFIFILSTKFNARNIHALWAWNDPQNFEFLDTDAINTVAYLATSITIQDGTLTSTPRWNQILFPKEDHSRIAVVRIDIFDTDINTIREEYMLDEIIVEIIGVCASEDVDECQIDFDATESQRSLYRDLLDNLDDLLGEEDISLSITALASWCYPGSWMDDMPIDYAVPMVFSLHGDEHAIYNERTPKNFLQSKKCINHVGVSAIEPMPPRQYLHKRKIFVYYPYTWNSSIYKDVSQEIHTTSF